MAAMRRQRLTPGATEGVTPVVLDEREGAPLNL